MNFWNPGNYPLVNSTGFDEILPLGLYHCSTCSLVFVNRPKKPSEIFSEYSYLSSVSSEWLEECRTFAKGLVADKKSKIVEIACNDGYLLRNFLSLGYSDILGIEPSQNAAEIALAQGIPVIKDFFTSSLAKELADKGKADILIAFNVLAHVPDILDFIKGTSVLLSEKGYAVFQFHYLPYLLENMQLDTIYHEHFTYLCLNSVSAGMSKNGLRIFRSEKSPSQGGSLRIHVSHKEAAHLYPLDRSVREFLHYEEKKMLFDHSTFRNFASEAKSILKYNRKFLNDLSGSKHRIAGYGASAKAVIFLNSIDADNSLISCIADQNEIKQGKMLSGTNIPVVSPEFLLMEKPEYIIIFSWNLRNEISRFLKERMDYDAKFIVFTPKPEIFN
jgi:SAM-dependent methyltransferase